VWEEVFGAANSLFEQFIQNMLMRLAELQLQRIGSTIFSFLLGSMGIPSGGNVPSSGANRPIIINIDGQTVATSMQPYMSDSIYTLTRRKLI
jgi:hypothetical protein